MTLAIGTTWWDRLMRLWFAVTARARTATALLRTPTALLDDCCCCFELTDCDGVAPDLLVDNNLSASVGKVVDVGGVCYQVATAADCTGATTEAIVATHDTCAECSPTCYDLHDCRDAAPGKKVDNDLSMVGSVKIGGTCYQVDEAPDCVGATTETIAETHDNCVECETGGQGEFCKDRCGLGVEAPTAFIVTLSGLSVCDECHLDAQAGVYVIFEGDPNGTYLLPEREPFGPCSWRLTIDGAGHRRLNYGVGDTTCSTLSSTRDYRYELLLTQLGATGLQFRAGMQRFDGSTWRGDAAAFAMSQLETISCTHSTTINNIAASKESTCDDEDAGWYSWGGTATFWPI